jgi:tetratricopeptide (TPR) repeat protein
MIILSVEDPIEKGKVFEEFISILLSRLGYQITNSRVRKSGRELDIQAVSKVTSAPILIECKAESSPIGGTAFNKFYGIFEHEAKKSQVGLTGIMISLSGFNSEVIAYYDEKEEEDKRRFKIYGPDFVIERAVDARLVADDRTVQHLARKSWPFELGETLLVITKSQIYRVQVLQRNGINTHFIVYRAMGDDPTEYEITMTHTTVSALRKLEPFNLQARKEVLLALSQAESAVDVESLRQLSKQSLATIENELTYFRDRNLIEADSRSKLTLVHDLRAFCEISIELLSSAYRWNFMLSKYFERMNNERLAEYCLSRRYLEAKEEGELSVLCSIFRFSPSALNHALFGEIGRYAATYEHAKEISTGIEWLPDSLKHSFITELIPNLLNDLDGEGNKVIDSLPAVVGWLEEHHIAIANSWEEFLNIQTSGIRTRLKAGEDMKAGQLVTIKDPITRFNSEMTRVHLRKEAEPINEMIKIYHEIKSAQPEGEDLPKLANNIAVSYMAIQDYGKAKEWLEEGLKYNSDIPQLHDNLTRVTALLAEGSSNGG